MSDQVQGNGATGGSAAAQTSDAVASDQSNANETLTFEGWYDKSDDTVRALLDNHTKGLKTALETERETRKSFERQIRELAVSAGKEGELKNQLSELSAQLQLSERRASFAEMAQREGVSNPKALFTLAAAGEFFDKKGNADFSALRKEFPEMFKNPIPKGNAGDGANSTPAPNSMNDIIRRAAGVK